MTQALTLSGEEYTVEKIMDELLKDKLFYDNSGGGITLSGGEPLAQFSFSSAVLNEAKRSGIHTCVETCGFASEEQIRNIAPYVDLFLYDYKESDSDLHKKYIGASNEKILKNLDILDSLDASIVLRCPVIPTFNDRDSHFRAIAQLAESHKNIIRIDVEPYHPLGSGKSEMLGEKYLLSGIGFPSDETVAEWIGSIERHTAVPVKGA